MPIDRSPVIEIASLKCQHGKQVILEDVSFAVARGELFFIIGRNGCGKSTLLKHMVGLMEPTAGHIKYFGNTFHIDDPSARLALLKSFGVLFQNEALWSWMTVGENVALPLEEHAAIPKTMRHKLVTLKLRQVGLKGFEHYYPRELSGGMRKRAGLARAMALDPAIVFLDEPTVGLDPVTSRQINELILRLRETLGTTIVIVSHILSHIFAIADRLILLDQHQRGIVAEGSPHEIIRQSTDPRVQEFFRQDTPSTPL